MTDESICRYRRTETNLKRQNATNEEKNAQFILKVMFLSATNQHLVIFARVSLHSITYS